MKAVTAVPGDPESLRLDEFDDPEPDPGELLVEMVVAGICGTDHEILEGDIGYPAPGRDRLVLGHEALGKVIAAPEGSDFGPGDLVAPIVRRPDPVPCANCAVGEWDMCRNGLFTEAGIRGLDGYTAQKLSLPAEFAVKVSSDLGHFGVLVEPASIVAKAYEHIIHIGSRATWSPDRVLVTGAGPIGLLAALFATRLGEEVHVLDRATDGPKPGLVDDLGAMYHNEGLDRVGHHYDLVLECTGNADLMMTVSGVTGPNGIVCLAGVPDEGHQVVVGSVLARNLVLENRTIFGTVNSNRRHYEEAARVLAQTDKSWLGRLVNRRVPLDVWREAYRRQPDDVKTVIEFSPPEGGSTGEAGQGGVFLPLKGGAPAKPGRGEFPRPKGGITGTPPTLRATSPNVAPLLGEEMPGMGTLRVPRRNRVDPWGDLHASPERGLFTGNRGCLVDDGGRPVRHHRGSLWITCLLEYQGWRHPLERPGTWTPLFFLDDAVALAAGHRPCGLCRRRAYLDYRGAVTMAAGSDQPLSAGDLNRRLGRERLNRGRGVDRAANRIPWTERVDRLPIGTVVIDEDEVARLVMEDRLLRFTFAGWTEPRPRRRAGTVVVLTPPTSVAALANGYTPVLHPTASG